MRVYPNPTKDQVTISNTMIVQDLKVSICDATGRVIMEQAIISNEQKVNTSPLSNGIYFMNIKQGSSTLRTLKLVKE
jgi:hypothetical protein